MNNREILWETVFYEYNPVDKVYNEKEDVDEVPYEDENVFKMDEMMEGFRVQEFVTTPAGIFKLDDALNPARQFKFYQAHTNFKITHEDVSILNNEVNGIDFLRIISPHRFIISIGKCFKISEVRLDIQNKLRATKHEKDGKD